METWIEKPTEAQMVDIHKLMLQEWWSSTRTLSEVKSVIEGSDLVLTALDEDQQVVAFTRVLTDGIFKAVLFDVIVRADYRGTGIGATLINKVRQHPTLSDVKSLELYCPDHVSGFYTKLGFKVSDSRLHLLKGFGGG